MCELLIFFFDNSVEKLVVQTNLDEKSHMGAVLLTVGRSYVGNDVTHSTLLDRACTCSYENLPKYRSYRVSNTAPCSGHLRPSRVVMLNAVL